MRDVDQQGPSRGAGSAMTAPLLSAVGFDIQDQYPGGRWNWIIVNAVPMIGGSNDCKCGGCTPVSDTLIGADAASGGFRPFCPLAQQRCAGDVDGILRRQRQRVIRRLPRWNLVLLNAACTVCRTDGRGDVLDPNW